MQRDKLKRFPAPLPKLVAWLIHSPQQWMFLKGNPVLDFAIEYSGKMRVQVVASKQKLVKTLRLAMDLCCSRILNAAEPLPLWKQPLWLCEMLMEMATMILCRQGEKGKSRSNGVQMESTLPLDVEFFQ